MSFKIREADINDYTYISNLVIEIHNLHVQNRPDIFSEVDNPFLKEQFEDLLNNSHTKVFVVEDTDIKELVAYSIVQIMTPANIPILISSKYAYIEDLSVKSIYQGMGIGKFLFNHVSDYAKTNGASSIQLNVYEFNEKAIKFYESLGMITSNRIMELNL